MNPKEPAKETATPAPSAPQAENADTQKDFSGVEISPPPAPPSPDSTSDRPDFQSGNF